MVRAGGRWWAAIATANGRHAMTIAAGPFLEVANRFHGTLPFARAELAYVYRAPFGLMVLAGGGLNFALASSPYVTPPETPCPPSSGDSFSFCLNFGPDAQEIPRRRPARPHAGGRRLAVLTRPTCKPQLPP